MHDIQSQFHIEPRLVERYIHELAKHGACGKSGVSRTVYSPEWAAAQDQIAVWYGEAGLEVRRDAVGNVWGTLRGSHDRAGVVSGSHIDTQAGRYDGALGVVAALIALRTLRERFGAPRRTLEAVSLAEEEGTRFPAANMWGTRAITGTIESHEPHEVRAASGETVAEAMKAVDLDPALIPEAKRDDVDTFIELHIEQGPILEEANLPLGIVSTITGLRHYEVEITGRVDHAGARPMDRRLDPMTGAAEMISGVIGIARDMGWPAVTTVGRISADPNEPAAVPGKVAFTIDTRHPDPISREELYRKQEALMKSVTSRHKLSLRWVITVDTDPCLCDPLLVEQLRSIARRQGITTMKMYSGGGHDAQRMATIAKVAMIFVQSKDGRSHTPDEFTSAEHAAAGIRLLVGALHELAY